MNPHPITSTPTDQQDSTVTVELWVDPETDKVWLTGPTAGADVDQWTAQLPATRWRDWTTAVATLEEIVDEAIAASGRDRTGRCSHPCTSWTGWPGYARTSWYVQAPTGPDDQGPVRVSPWNQTKPEAEDALAVIRATSTRMVLITDIYGTQLVPVDPDTLTIGRHDTDLPAGLCERCGWGRHEHDIDGPGDTEGGFS